MEETDAAAEPGVPVDGRPQVTARADRIRDLSSLPIWVAPMAGGPSTPALVAAAARAGGFGFLAGGYRNAAALRADMEAVRATGTPAFGVNLFVPGAPAGDPEQGATASTKVTGSGWIFLALHGVLRYAYSSSGRESSCPGV